MPNVNMEKIKEIVLNSSKADETECCLIKNNIALTRFANSSIHQNVEAEDNYMRLRIIKDKKCGATLTNILTEGSIRDALDKAIELSSFAYEDAYLSLPKPQTIEEIPVFYKETAEVSPNERAEIVKRIIEEGEKNGCVASGSFKTGHCEISICNSLGIDTKAETTSASIVIVMEKDGASGYASGISRDVRKIDFEALTNIAIEKAILGRNPREIEMGEYEVILEPPAVSDLLLFLGYLGFNSLAFLEKRSFMCGNIGKKIMSSNVTIWDDGYALDGMAMPFDFEGVRKEKVVFIERGIAKSLCYDTYTANRGNTISTGHSFPQPNTCGPIPINLFMEGGDATKEEMIKNTKRGLLVTRFHYTNVIEPIKAIITGMTRDGTFLIENGKISYPVKNMRFTQSIIDALSNVSMISKERRLCSAGMILEFQSSTYVPFVKIERFNFTGRTKF